MIKKDRNPNNITFSLVLKILFPIIRTVPRISAPAKLHAPPASNMSTSAVIPTILIAQHLHDTFLFPISPDRNY